MIDLTIPGRKKGFLETLRVDKWWAYPASVLGGLLLFIVYATWAGLQADHYWVGTTGDGFGGYLASFCSPLFFVKSGLEGVAPVSHAFFGEWPGWWPEFIPASPSIFILIAPLVARFTCYYYRKAYYRAFAGSPPACAVGAVPQKPYKGETGLLVIQNIHRMAIYLVVPFVIFFFYDAILAFFRDGQFGVGVGSIILLINPVLLGGWTFGCHAVRNVVGGHSNCMSCSKFRYGAWKKVSWLNARHELFAWLSLIWVALADLYVRMVAMGIWTDYNTWG